MEYTTLGHTGMKVSRLILGTMSFGDHTEEKEAFKIMDCALEAGINMFDTSNTYGPTDPVTPWITLKCGVTEEIIGRWFAQGGGRRERVILATKVYEQMDEPYDGPNNAEGLSAYKVRRQLENSLRRLQTDHVELYQLHHSDNRVTWEEMWGVLENVVSSGKAYYIGSSNFGAHDIVKAQWKADKRNFLGLVSEQHRYNPMFRHAELEVIPTLQDLGMGMIIWGPLAQGRMAGIVPKDCPESVAKQIRDYASLASDLNTTAANLTLAWLLHQPFITAPLTGPQTLAHLESSLKALELKLSEDTMKRIDEIFPPFGAAPDYYTYL